MPRLRSLFAVLSLLLPATAAAQEPRLSARLDAATLAAVRTLLDSAAQEGLPAEPLIQKALEGQTKGADGPRIAAAVRTLFVNLRTAHTSLGDAAEPDLVAAAVLLRAGLPSRMLTDLKDLRPGRPLAVPLGVLTDLVARGMPMETAWRSVERLARANASDAQFVALRQRQAEELGASPGATGLTSEPQGMPAAGAPRRP